MEGGLGVRCVAGKQQGGGLWEGKIQEPLAVAPWAVLSVTPACTRDVPVFSAALDRSELPQASTA